MGYPGLLLTNVPLPVDQILEAAALGANIQDMSDRVCWMIVHDPGRWRGFGQRAKFAGCDGLELEHVETWVDAQQLGQSEENSRGIDDALDFKLANVPGGEFLGLGFEGNVFDQEPNLLLRLEIRIRGSAAVCQVPVAISRAEELKKSPRPEPLSTPCSTDIGLDQGHGNTAS